MIGIAQIDLLEPRTAVENNQAGSIWTKGGIPPGSNAFPLVLADWIIEAKRVSFALVQFDLFNALRFGNVRQNGGSGRAREES